MNIRRLVQSIGWVAILLLSLWWVPTEMARYGAAPYPNRPIEVVVPYPAGGGSDTFVRTLQKGFIEDNLLPYPLVIINVKGGGGTIGSRDVKDAKPDGYRILCHHNAIITAKISETVDYGPEAFEQIAMTGSQAMVIIVREDSPYTGLQQLLNAAKESPKQLTFGANQGAPAYFATLQLEKSVPGAQFSIVSADGGADRYASILGGHLTAAIFSLPEYLDFRAAEGTPSDRNIRAIAVLSPERHEAIPEVATSLEQDVAVTLGNANYWWAPKGTPREVISLLADALEKAIQNETVQKELTRLRVDLKYAQGEALAKHLNETSTAFASAVDAADVGSSVERKNKIPDFAAWVGGIVVVLFLAMLVETFLRRNRPEAPDAAAGIPIAHKDFVRRPYTAAGCFVALIAYVYILGQHWLPFAISTTLMVLVIGGLMTRWQRQHWIILLQLALVTGLGTNFIFTEVFTTTLP